MQVISRRHAPQANLPASEVLCPCCQGKLIRERRRMVDRLRSLIRPAKRYRCDNFACQWMGNLANADTDKSGAGDAAGAQTPGDDNGRNESVPAAFIVHMMLAAAAVVFVLVYGTMEPTASFDESELAPGLTVLE